MEKSKVTVIVLTYNQENTISRTIESILEQVTDFSYEILIGEDASTDNTRNIVKRYCKRYPDKIRLMPESPNKGVYRNSFECLLESRSEYVSFCFGDDFYCNKKKLQYQLDYLEKHPSCVGIHSEMKHFDCRTKEIITPPLRSEVPEGNLDKIIFFEHIVFTPTLMFRRSALSDEKLKELLKRSFSADDIVFLCYLAQQGDIHYTPKFDVVYSVGAETTCQSSDFNKKFNFMWSVYSALEYIYNDLKPQYPKKILLRLKRYDLCRLVLSGKNIKTIIRHCKHLLTTELMGVIIDMVVHENKKRQKIFERYCNL